MLVGGERHIVREIEGPLPTPKERAYCGKGAQNTDAFAREAKRVCVPPHEGSIAHNRYAAARGSGHPLKKRIPRKERHKV